MDISFGFLYKLIVDFSRLIRGRRRTLTPSEIAKLREKWKPIFEEKILIRNRDNLRSDVIIRDVKHMDIYPDIPDEKGISPWFRAGLADTYHRGIQVGLGYEGLCRTDTTPGWRKYDHKVEQPDITACLIGFIRFENIESVQWDGDEYYGYPHIYCHFTEKKKQPYERVVYCEEKNNGHFDFYTELADFDAVGKSHK